MKSNTNDKDNNTKTKPVLHDANVTFKCFNVNDNDKIDECAKHMLRSLDKYIPSKDYGFTSKIFHTISAMNNMFQFRYNTISKDCIVSLNVFPIINIRSYNSCIKLRLDTIEYNNFGEFKICKMNVENNPKINRYRLEIEGNIYTIRIEYLDKGNVMIEVDNLSCPLKFKINLLDVFKTQKSEYGYMKEYTHRIYSVDRYVCDEKVSHQSKIYDFITLFNKGGFAIYSDMMELDEN